MKLLNKLMGKKDSADNNKESAAHVEKDKSIRENLTEKETDKMIADTFPASDPASTY